MAGALRIIYRPVADLVPYARNARTHDDAQVEQIAASVREFGWTNPVLVDGDNGIIAGHGRVLAAQLLGMEKVPCLALGHLTDVQRRAYILADNKLALNAGWNEDLLRAELTDLKAMGVDLGLVGFGDDELAALYERPTPGFGDQDAVPEVEAAIVAAAGNVWLLGGHRLICGDSTDAATIAALLAGERPQLMVTDPPYGVDYDPSWRVGLHRTKRDGSPLDGPRYAATGVVANDKRVDWSAAWALFEGAVAYVWHAGVYAGEVGASLLETGFVLRSQIIWRKSHFALGRGDYHWQHEPCWYAVRQGEAGRYNGDRKQTTVWDITSGVGFTTQTEGKDARTGHSTQKPVECMRRPIENNSKPGEAVYEPFSGSGSTILAADIMGRRCYAAELNPAYVDVAVRRWQTFTGKVATLEGDGRTFDDVAASGQKAPAGKTAKAATRKGATAKPVKPVVARSKAPAAAAA